MTAATAAGPVDPRGRPLIRKLGAIACDLVECNPVVWQDQLWIFQSVRAEHRHNPRPDHCLWFRHFHDQHSTQPFGEGYMFGCAFVDGARMIVTASIPERRGIDVFASEDLEHWEQWPALRSYEHKFYNTSMARVNDRYLLMYEVDGPAPLTGPPFSARFAWSDDLVHWEQTDAACVYATDRYSAPHCLRYLDGWYYNFFLEQYDGFGTRVARSRDLRSWRCSYLDPVLKADDHDRGALDGGFSPEERQRLREAENCNNSDIDFCTWKDRLIITYSWGSQRGCEHLALAVYDGSQEQFLRGWFPDGD